MPLQDYYEEIDEIVKDPVIEPPKKKSFNNYKTYIYIFILIILIIFFISQFISAYMETLERRRVMEKMPLIRLKIKAVGAELDAFFDKNEYYPPGLERFTINKKYFNFKIEDEKIYFTDKTIILDPFTDDKSPFGYRLGKKSVIEFEKNNPKAKVIINPYNFWMIYSVGPDKKDNEGSILYDPTNGILSSGDIAYWSMRGRYIKPGSKREKYKNPDDIVF